MKKIIYLLLAFVLCLSVVGFVACSDDGKGSEYYTISDFETEDELMAMNWKNSFGIVKLNTESQYVKSGSASARLEIHGDPMSGAGYTPYGIVYTNDNVYNFRKTDYSDVEAFEFSFYNASDRDTTVKFQFMSSAIYKGGLSSEQSFTLKKGEWTDISMPIDRNLLTAFMDLSAISEFYFKFENREEGQEPLVLYLDRFVAKTTDEPINTDTDIRKENEIESADRAEYLGAWEVTANRGASLTFNTDPEYIREGTGSFHFTAEPTGGVNWPEIVLKSNMLTDISDYDSIYFWMYNDNPDPYDIVTAGGTTIKTVQPGEWTLMDMKVIWIANVMNFTHDAKEYDIANFNNFTISLTNNNKKLSFYFDGFYARKAGEGYIGEDEPGAPIELSQSGVIKVESGKEFTVPTVTNASAYETVEWTISQTLEAAVYEYLVNAEWNNAASFTPADNAGYVIEYKAVDADGKISRASVNVIASKDADAFDMTYGATDGLDTFTDTLMSGTFKSVSAELNTDEKYILFGENSVKLTFPEFTDEAQAAFTWTPGFNINAYDWVTFYFYNPNDTEYTIISTWGAQFKLKPGAWVVRTVPVAQFNSWVGAAPDIHSGEEFSMSFYTPMTVGTAATDIYFQITTHGYHEVPPLVKIPKTTDVVEKGATVTVPESTSKNVTWSLFYNDEPVAASDNIKTFVAENYGIYKVVYSRTEGDLTGTAEYAVYVPDVSTLADLTDAKFTDDVLRDDPTVAVEDDLFLGESAIHVTGTKVGPDIGFVWHTGVYNDLNSVTIYVYNNSEGVVNLVHSWGLVAVMQPGTWTAVTIEGGKLTSDAAGWKDDCSTTQVGRIGGEWVFAFPMNVAATTNYDITIAVSMDKGEVPAPTIELDKTTDVAATGTEYTVPAVDGAEWEVYFNDALFGGATTNTGFTPTAAGTYEVRYTKEQGGQTAKATLTVHVADLSKIESPNDEFTDDALRDDPTVAVEDDLFLGESAIHVTGTKVGPDIGFVWHTGVYNDLNSVTIYVYNNSEGVVNLVHSWGAVAAIQPGAWTAITIEGGKLTSDAASWKDDCSTTQVGRIAGEWVFAFPMNVAATTNYDITIAVVMDKGEIPAPTIELDKTTDVAAIGAEYTVPAVDGAEWQVYFNDALFGGATTNTGFTPTAAGTYEVRYTKEQGGQTAKATLTVYVADVSKIVVPNEEFTDDALREDPTVTVEENAFLGASAIHVTGTKGGPDIGFVWHTGITEDINSITFYVYNNSNGVVGVIFGSGLRIDVEPQGYGSTTFAGSQLNEYVGGWKDDCGGTQVGRIDGEWVIAFPANILAVSGNYDFTIAVAVETAA